MDSAPVVLELDPAAACGCAVTLLVVHPDEAVRARVLSAAPSSLLPLGVARPDHIGVRLARAAERVGTLVVALDPARTPVGSVRSQLSTGEVHLMSVSDLQLGTADPGVDSTLPRRRLSRTSLLRHLRAVGLLHAACGPARRRPEPVGAVR